MTTHSPTSEGVYTQRQILTIFGGLMAGMSLASLDGTAVNTALATMVADLGGLSSYAWVGTSYLLTSAVANALFGKLSDIYGRKRLFQIAILTFLVGSVGCGVAQSMIGLVISRGVQGIGGGGLMSMAFVIIGDVLPPRERGRYMGLITSVFAIGSVVGPLIGGFFVTQLSWRWIFFVNLPVGAIALVITSRALRMPVRRIERQVDYLGAALLTTAVSCLILMLSWSSNDYGWGSPLTITLGLSSFIFAVAFVQWEKRASEPIMPLHLFQIDVLRITLPLVAFVGTIVFGATAFIPLYLQAVTGFSPTLSGLLLVPTMAGITIMSVTTGRRTTSTGKYRHWPIFGASSLILGMILLSNLGKNGLHFASGLCGMFCVGLGIGSILPTATLATQNAVEWTDLGVASAVVTFFRTLGGVIGLAAFGALLNSNISGKIDKKYLRAPREIKHLPEPLRSDVLRVLGDGITNLYKSAVPVAVLALFIAWRMPERPLRKTSATQDSIIAAE